MRYKMKFKSDKQRKAVMASMNGNNSRTKSLGVVRQLRPAPQYVVLAGSDYKKAKSAYNVAYIKEQQRQAKMKRLEAKTNSSDKEDYEYLKLTGSNFDAERNLRRLEVNMEKTSRDYDKALLKFAKS